VSLLRGFKIVPLQEKDAVVQERMEAFYNRIGVEKPWRSPAIKWLGFAKHGAVALVVGIFVNPSDALEVTDFYPAPTRDGVDAGYVGLRLLKMLVDEKVIPRWFGGVVWANKRGQQRAERYFGITPRSVVYSYEGNA
jgi:hypothetical protein